MLVLIPMYPYAYPFGFASISLMPLLVDLPRVAIMPMSVGSLRSFHYVLMPMSASLPRCCHYAYAHAYAYDCRFTSMSP